MRKLKLLAATLTLAFCVSGCASRQADNRDSYIAPPQQSTDETDDNTVLSPQDNEVYKFNDINGNTFTLHFYLGTKKDNIKNSAEWIDYETIARSRDGLKDSCVAFTGYIDQVLENDALNLYEGLISVSYYDDPIMPYFDDQLYFVINRNYVSQRILEGDIVDIYGQSLGLYTYESTLGAPITVPIIELVDIQFY